MKKIKLELDTLAVESFETNETEREQGTVHGHWISNKLCESEVSCRYTCYYASCFDTQCYCEVPSYPDNCGDPYQTVYYESCQISCYATCTC
ncbi:MAG: pinensin family lanthipeptide [Longimicrobiaceae bacterium]